MPRVANISTVLNFVNFQDRLAAVTKGKSSRTSSSGLNMSSSHFLATHKALSLALAFVIVTVFLSTNNAFAFYTFTAKGGAVHEDITRTALCNDAKFGMSQESFAQIDAGNTRQDVVGTAPFQDATHHFDNCKFKGSVGYVEACYTDIGLHLCNSDSKESDWRYVLNKFGELLHPLQDFYSHSNYVELALKTNGALTPQQIPLVSWRSISPNVRTGFFYYKTFTNNEAYMLGDWNIPESDPNRDKITPLLIQDGDILSKTTYVNNATYSKLTSFSDRLAYATNLGYSMMHRDINKDNATTEEGRVVNPQTKTNLFTYARALAIRETQRQWLRLEGQVRRTCPSKADSIIEALKKGIHSTSWVRSAPKISKTVQTGANVDVTESSIVFSWRDYSGKARQQTFNYTPLPAGLNPGDELRLALSCPPAFIESSGDRKGINAGFHTNDYDYLEGVTDVVKGSEVPGLTTGSLDNNRLNVTSAWWGFKLKQKLPTTYPLKIRLVVSGPDYSNAVLEWTYKAR